VKFFMTFALPASALIVSVPVFAHHGTAYVVFVCRTAISKHVDVLPYSIAATAITIGQFRKLMYSGLGRSRFFRVGRMVRATDFA